MMSHPGKKLMFMGGEIGQFKEWDFGSEIEYFMLNYPKHECLKEFFKDINHLYKRTSAFYEIEDSWAGFEWLNSDDRDNNVISYKRMDSKGMEIVVIINFSGTEREDYHLGVDEGKYKVIFSSDSAKYGGEDKYAKRIYNTYKKGANGKPCSIYVSMNRFSALYLQKL
jgi:1,4-alpha-glucan branching enzyme